MEVTITQAPRLAMDIIEAGLVPMFHGSPGVGKSQIIKLIAKEYNLFLVDYRLGDKDPTEVQGYPTLNMDRTRSLSAPPMSIPIETDTVPEGYDGWLLAFDELNVAPQATQASGYKVILDKMVGDIHIHPKVCMIAAGNKDTDRAYTNKINTAMQSRLVHLVLKVDVQGWLAWAHKADVDYRVRRFIDFKPHLLHAFDPKHKELTFPCPRTNVMLSDIVKQWKTIPADKLPIFIGTVGKGAALEFMAYIDIMQEIPEFREMLSQPASVAIPTDPSIQHAMAGIISNRANIGNIERLMVLVDRFPMEFQAMCLQDIAKYDLTLLESKPIDEWMDKHSDQLANNY